MITKFMANKRLLNRNCLQQGTQRIVSTEYLFERPVSLQQFALNLTKKLEFSLMKCTSSVRRLTVSLKGRLLLLVCLERKQQLAISGNKKSGYFCMPFAFCCKRETKYLCAYYR